MNIELDRQIAILKGATHDLSGNAFTFYSESDSKALELVDEAQTKDGVFEFCITGTNFKDEADQWSAWFAVLGGGVARGTGRTRPEAICRAYIAAVTWMREKKG